MKKTLLSLVAICCFCAAPAQESPVSFQTHEAVITSVSSNGSYAVGSTQGVGYFVNAKTGKLTRFEDPGVAYDIRAVADCGIAGGFYSSDFGPDTACYVTEEKGIVPLPLREGITSGDCMGASADGSFLVGNVFIPQNGMILGYTQPVVWYRNQSGEYDVYEELPLIR